MNLTEVKWIKNVTDPRGVWAYQFNEDQNSESMVIDDPVDSVNVFKHPQEAIQYAIARLSYYIQES